MTNPTTRDTARKIGKWNMIDTRYLSPAMLSCYDETSEHTDVPNADDPDRMFSQHEVNKLMQRHRVTLQRDLSMARDRVTELEAQAIDWQERFDAAQIEAAAAVEAARTETSTLRGEFDVLRDKHDRQLVDRSLSDAIAAGDAFSAEPVMAILAPHARMVGDKVAVDVEGFSLSPAEAVAWMRGQPDRFGNLFRSNIIGGLGGNSHVGGATGKRPNIKDLTTEQYQKLRRENPGALGLSGGDE